MQNVPEKKKARCGGKFEAGPYAEKLASYVVCAELQHITHTMQRQSLYENLKEFTNCKAFIDFI